MQGFLFSCPPGAGQRRPLTPFPIVVTCEAFPSGRRVCWPLSAGQRRCPLSGLQVAILYEDFATGRRARKFCRFLVEQLGASGPVEPALCFWDLLHNPLLQSRAARAVTRADLLILSVHQHLPAVSTGALLDAWLAAKARRASGLVAMVDGTGARGSVAAFLCELAWRRGLYCLEQRIEDPDDPEQGSVELVWVI
jgi:hypothetical protein